MKGISECAWVRGSEFAVRLCLLVSSEAAPIKSHGHGHINTNWARMTAMEMPNKIEEAQETSTLCEEEEANEKSWKWERWSSSEKRMAIGFLVPNNHPWKPNSSKMYNPPVSLGGYSFEGAHGKVDKRALNEKCEMWSVNCNLKK